MSVYDKGILRGHFSAEDFLSLLISLYFYQIWLDFLLTMEYFMGMWISVIGSSLTKMTSAAVYQVRTVSRWRFLISQPPPLSLSYSRSLSLSVSHSTTLICLWMEKEASTRGATSGQRFLPICVFMCAYIAPLAVNEKTSFRYHLTTTERNSVHSDSWLWLTTHITSFNSDPFTIIGSLWCARRQTEDRVTHKVFLLKEWIISKWDMKLASYNIHHMHVVIIYRDKRA